MLPDNDSIAAHFAQLAKLMDIHGENAFKARSYSVAAFAIENHPEPLAQLPHEKLFDIKGIGEAIGKKIIEIIETGHLSLLEKLLQKTPPGILEMLLIKGIGPKKIAIIWKEMEIESLGELLYACNENRLTLYKGFGEKTQRNVKEAIEFYFRNQDRYLYVQVERYVADLEAAFKAAMPSRHFMVSGEFKRQLETISTLEWVTTATPEECAAFAAAKNFQLEENSQTRTIFKEADRLPVVFSHTPASLLYPASILHSSSSLFADRLIQTPGWKETENASSEEEVFRRLSLPFVPPALREEAQALGSSTPHLIEVKDIRGIIHSHSDWSDGSNTLEEMARGCIDLGLEYLVISDHSKSAFYARGLPESRIEEQHRLVDKLNTRLAPFRIFKSIESDILNDGSLDYSNDVLSTFDLVIASIHSNLKMPEEKAMQRLITAIENPYTTILGHMTGRLLLSRKGYPVDHKKVIDACAANQVAIELNAHPRRLDIDWRHIGYALEKGVLISIDPDAHVISGFQDIRYGVLVAQKAGLTPAQNLSSLDRTGFGDYLARRREAKQI